MNKNLLSIIIAAVLIILGGVLIFGYNNGFLSQMWADFSKPKVDVNGIILFYGDGCPHCKIVDDFIKANNVESKIKFTRLEVFNNRDNGKILLERAKACGLATDQVGVPFLWDGKTCIMGDQDTINFFKTQAGIK